VRQTRVPVRLRGPRQVLANDFLHLFADVIVFHYFLRCAPRSFALEGEDCNGLLYHLYA
jgi:hypothetical protein